MDYKEYAFIEYVRDLDTNPHSRVALVADFTGKCLQTLAAMTEDELVKWPSVHALAIPISPAALETGNYAKANDALAEGSIIQPPGGLPAIFSTLAYASAQGREIRFVAAEPAENLNKEDIEDNHYRIPPGAFIGNVLKGAIDFFNKVHWAMERPDRVMVYAYVQPRALN